jgi:hypothetical protein
VFDVDIRLEHLGHQLRTGMTANIEVRGEARDGVLCVPLESVFIRGEQELVYVERESPLPEDAAEGGDAPWKDDPRQTWRRWFDEREVITGIASTADVEILDGLGVGDKVALADPTRVKDEGDES